MAMVAACLAPVALAGLAGQRMTRSRPALTLAATALASWTVLGGASLGGSALALGRALDAGDLAAARRMLPTLCGRDPAAARRGRAGPGGGGVGGREHLGRGGRPAALGRAWPACPVCSGYRAVNTLDAMIGLRSPRYQRFGWAAARLDDVANLIPARVTGLLAVALAPTVGGSSRRALGTLLRDGRRHPSPNAGQCEAAFAGALGVRLGGRNSYQGRAEQRGLLGDGRPAAAPDISRAVRLSRLVSVAALGLAAIVAWRRT